MKSPCVSPDPAVFHRTLAPQRDPGDVRGEATDDLRLVVDGDRLTENFTRPGGTRITIVFERLG